MNTYEITAYFHIVDHTFYFTVRARTKAGALKQAKRKVDASSYRARRV